MSWLCAQAVVQYGDLDDNDLLYFSCADQVDHVSPRGSWSLASYSTVDDDEVKRTAFDQAGWAGLFSSFPFCNGVFHCPRSMPARCTGQVFAAFFVPT